VEFLKRMQSRSNCRTNIWMCFRECKYGMWFRDSQICSEGCSDRNGERRRRRHFPRFLESRQTQRKDLGRLLYHIKDFSRLHAVTQSPRKQWTLVDARDLVQ